MTPPEPSSPIEFSEQEVEGAARRVHQLLQHRDVTASQDLQDTSKAGPLSASCPRRGGALRNWHWPLLGKSGTVRWLRPTEVGPEKTWVGPASVAEWLSG